MEDRTRRNNLRIDGIPESNDESWDDTEELVKSMLKTNLNIENVTIGRAHRMTTRRERRGKPRTVIIKVLDFKDKTRILRNCKKLKGTNIFIYEDFSAETMEIRKVNWEEVKRLRKEEGKFAILIYDKIYQRDHYIQKDS